MGKEKIELKDIAGYLPYHLHVKDGEDDALEVTIDKAYNPYKFTHADIVIHRQYKPILRPMSDITDKIIEDGYNSDLPFIPLIEIAEAVYPDMMGWKIDEDGCAYTRDNGYPQWVRPKDIEIASFDIFDLLNQWHFDYRGLIEKGLAIDINTIKKT